MFAGKYTKLYQMHASSLNALKLEDPMFAADDPLVHTVGRLRHIDRMYIYTPTSNKGRS